MIVIVFPIALLGWLVCMCTPLKQFGLVFLNKCTKRDIEGTKEDNDIYYSDQCVYFGSCYDSSNPATSKAGTLRLLNSKIRSLERKANTSEEGKLVTEKLIDLR